MRFTLRSRLLVTFALALLLVLVFTATALALTPANDGAGQDFGQRHAACAQAGMLGQDMNPGMHRGVSGWREVCPDP